MAVILPFEADFYHRYQVPATFVGHPLLDGNDQLPSPSDPPQTPTIGLLPGSRDKEVLRLLPEMLETARILKERIPGVMFLLSRAPSVKQDLFDDIISRHGSSVEYKIETGNVHNIFQRSTLLVAASGTVTLEAAMAGVPTVIAYKVSPVSYRLGRMLIRVPHIGLANLIAGKEIVPELVQGEASAENIAETVLRMLRDPKALAECRQALLKLRHELGGPGASGRVADIAARLLGLSPPPGMKP
jgi:lipid-A-disaccharide synthase